MSYGTSSDPNLRRRSDYFANPESPSVFEGSVFTDMSYPPYSELPFSSLKRRKQSGSGFVKWTMRAVLASPVIVLVVWSSFAIMFSSKQTAASINRTNNHKGQRKKTNNNRNLNNNPYNNNNMMMYNPYLFQNAQPQQQMLQTPQQQQQGYNMAPQQQPYGATPMQLQQQQQQEGVLMMNSNNIQSMMNNNGNTQGGVMMMNAPNDVQALQQSQQQQQGNIMPQMQTAQQQPLQAPQPVLMMASANQEAPMGATSSSLSQTSTAAQNTPVMTPEQFLATHPHLRQGKTIPVIQPLGSTAAAGEQAQITQPMGNAQVTQPMASQQQGEAPMGSVRIEPLQAGVNITQPNPLGKEAAIYYYYPEHAVDSYGNVKVPTVIFDRNGYPVDLKALQGKQVYMEPPRRSIAVGNIPASISKWGDSSSQDQSIIVATVAVMALLVGALSARRMRARSFLSVCIENESLEDDVAYDTAYTTTDHSYNTFGGWKGDLEKFDV